MSSPIEDPSGPASLEGHAAHAFKPADVPAPSPPPVTPSPPPVTYLSKFTGSGVAAPPLPSLFHMVHSSLGVALTLLLLSALQPFALPPSPAHDSILLTVSFAASAVLIHAAPASPLAQPPNVFFGHVLSALVGVGVRKWVVVAGCGGAQDESATQCTWFAGALATGGANFVMMVAGVSHPPGGATALTAVVGGPAVLVLGWWFVLMPVLVGAAMLVCFGCVVVNLEPGRRYPLYWWGRSWGGWWRQ